MNSEFDSPQTLLKKGTALFEKREFNKALPPLTWFLFETRGTEPFIPNDISKAIDMVGKVYLNFKSRPTVLKSLFTSLANLWRHQADVVTQLRGWINLAEKTEKGIL